MEEGRMNILAKWSFFYKLLLNINAMEIPFEKEIWELHKRIGEVPHHGKKSGEQMDTLLNEYISICQSYCAHHNEPFGNQYQTSISRAKTFIIKNKIRDAATIMKSNLSMMVYSDKRDG